MSLRGTRFLVPGGARCEWHVARYARDSGEGTATLTFDAARLALLVCAGRSPKVLVLLAIVNDDVPRRVLEATEHTADHDHVRAHGDALHDVTRHLQCA
jgi:hypothetical protein